MKTKYFLMFLVLLLSVAYSYEAVAQRCLVFGYDAVGNRVHRTVRNDCLEMRDVAEVQEVIVDKEMKVYPNPTERCFKIVMPDGVKHEQSYYKLYDMNGVLLLDDKLHGKETEIDVGNYPSGVYLLKIVSGEDLISKIILKL